MCESVRNSIVERWSGQRSIDIRNIFYWEASKGIAPRSSTYAAEAAGQPWPPPREREAWPDYTKIIDEQHRA